MDVDEMTTVPPVGLGERFMAAIYDPFLWLGERRGMRRSRVGLLREARGRVLEIGAGTGLNASHYPDDAEELILTEPTLGMYRRLRKRTSHDPRVAVVRATGCTLPVADSTVDTVVSTFVLCTVPEVEPVLAEIARVLRPDGRFLFLEHVRAADARLARRQDRFAPSWAAFAQGCQCNRDTERLLRDRFDFEQVQHGRWRGMPSLVRPFVAGTAVLKVR
jgi:ubiquinone/menaquinone biosynthesis C-methylase UbiE